MTNEEMKMALAKGGVSTADIEKVSDKFDAEKITEIVETASTPKEALEALNAFYPELEIEKMQEQMDFVQSQFEAAVKGEKSGEAVELTEEELDNVAGGGFCDWWSRNWKTVAIGAAILAGTVLICTGVGAIAGSFVTASAASAAAGTGATLVEGGIIGGSITVDTLISTGVLTATGAAGAAAGTMAGTGAAVGAAIGGLGGSIAGATYTTVNLK
ncbi:hypothetical protein [Treponema sp. UBA3813]|uniref:hypothetical protein n=1 Tax=Treponema sp. UBA3813 TaxID=1947715 RepID=UPI0025F0E772|nr:hypothetical protein [Treponema sp. UBA3813]